MMAKEILACGLVALVIFGLAGACGSSASSSTAGSGGSTSSGGCCSGALGTCAEPRIDDFCTNQAQCESGNKADTSACVASVRGEQDAAGAYGCAAQFGALLDCTVKT